MTNTTPDPIDDLPYQPVARDRNAEQQRFQERLGIQGATGATVEPEAGTDYEAYHTQEKQEQIQKL